MGTVVATVRVLAAVLISPVWLFFALLSFLIGYMNLLVGSVVIDTVPVRFRTPEMNNALHTMAERALWICPECSKRRGQQT